MKKTEHTIDNDLMGPRASLRREHALSEGTRAHGAQAKHVEAK